MSYRRRVIDELLDDLFTDLAAIALEGAKGVGKTATAMQRAESLISLDLPAQREIVAADLDYVTQVATPVLIDEWQLAPAVWDRVRKAVDEDARGGRFLLAGSAGVAPGARIHSGAGRIVSLTMRPVSVAERQLTEPTVSLSELLAGGRPPIKGRSGVDLAGDVEEILASGLPGIRDLPERARSIQLDSHVARIVERELPENGLNVRRPDALRAWLTAYAAATSTDAAYSKILDASTAGSSTSRRAPPSTTIASILRGSSSSTHCPHGCRCSTRSNGSPRRRSTTSSTPRWRLGWSVSASRGSSRERGTGWPRRPARGSVPCMSLSSLRA